jgi:4-amino-4-deoxy-L-arabinose transferase-like glycosyltransferase
MLVVMLIAAAARFHLLGAQSLWHDEGNSYVQSTRSLAAIAEHASRDIHPPGYYWLLAIWRVLTGSSEFALRSFSALASLLTVALTYAIGARLMNRASGAIAAALVALNTFSIYYAQEARMYALLTLWAAAAMWTLLGLLYAGKRGERALIRWAVALSLLNAAGLWTQYVYPLVMIVQGVMFALWIGAEVRQTRVISPALRRLITLYIAANGLTIGLFLPWLGTAWQQVTNWPNTGQPIPLMEALATILAWFALGLTSEPGITAPVAFFLLFGLLILPERRPRDWWRMMFPVLWVVVICGAFLWRGLFREANLKVMLPAQMAFALWLARGPWVLWHLQPRRESAMLMAAPRAAAVVGTIAVLAAMWSQLPALYGDPAYQRDDYRGIAAAITLSSQPGDAIILNAPNQQEVFSYYYDGGLPIYPLPRGLGGDDIAALAETQTVIESHERIFVVLWGTAERDPRQIVEGALDTSAFELDDRWYGDVRLARYYTPSEIPVTDSGAWFGEAIRLERYGVSALSAAPGDVLLIQLEWSASETMDVRYKVFVQLLTPQGTLAAQRDAEPVGNRSWTTTWTPGEIITDRHALIVPEDAAPGDYLLIVGLYDLNDPLARLPVDNSDHLLLATVFVTAPED